ncbi:hypothetical protein LTS15_000568 [Exophiala xenobiotica]|nr:hypothetical protein LTS15_000568 [Exophiala xenobiotica]
MYSSLYPHLIRLSFFAALTTTAQAGVANITMFYDTACRSFGQTIWPLLDHDGNCTSLLTTSNFVGIKATYLAQGCSLTFYSDQWCTDNQVEEYFSVCRHLVQSGNSTPPDIYSFSIDSCESPVASDWVSPTASTVTSSTSPSPTSAPSNPEGGDGLAAGSEIGSIVGAICGVAAIILSIIFGRNQWKKRQEDRAGAAEEREEKEATASPKDMMTEPLASNGSQKNSD